MSALILLTLAWGVLARELLTGCRNITRLEAYTYWAVLAVTSVLVLL